MTRFVRNRAFEAEMAASPATEAQLKRAARGVADEVRNAAPVGKHRGKHFKSSIRTDGRRVISTDPFAHLVEFGSVNNPPYAPFRRGVRAAGLRLQDDRTE